LDVGAASALRGAAAGINSGFLFALLVLTAWMTFSLRILNTATA
jgi:hypothetical protein